ncbi:GNAT family N-acetyltransferase [Leptolyngbya sp. AN02str]|uniref:GNAT family N-acetyltransferase n=1 Tax=Leptolyngbya sp. AN02str TaxID=3423363 RepID=UPI003D31FF3F
MAAIEFRDGKDLDVDAVIELYVASTLGDRRPIDDRSVMAAMVQNANLVVTAWDGAQLVGIARSLTDFVYVAYLSDLAVRQSHQRQGIGIQLVQKTKERLGDRASLILLAAPQAINYYPKIGFTQHPSAWVLDAAGPFPVP